jgi:hypothetical protein
MAALAVRQGVTRTGGDPPLLAASERRYKGPGFRVGLGLPSLIMVASAYILGERPRVSYTRPRPSYRPFSWDYCR